MKNADKAIHPISEDTLSGLKGLTKREHFAAMAMQGMLANPSAWTLYGPSEHSSWIVSCECVAFADALLEALEEGEQQTTQP